jgi:hypothetical protein
MQIPPGLEREGLEHYRMRVQEVLSRLTCEAEAWAAAGTRKLNQCCVRAEPAPLQVYELKERIEPETSLISSRRAREGRETLQSRARVA